MRTISSAESDEGRRIEEVGGIGPRPSDEDAAEERSERERHVLGGLEQAVRPWQLRVPSRGSGGPRRRRA